MSRRIVPYDRTRRKRHWSLGDPPKRRRRGARRLLGRRWYLKLPIYVVGAVMLAPFGADGLNFAFGAREVDGCSVSRVVDGDTVLLACADANEAVRVRLVGFDTPEKHEASCASEVSRAFAAEWYLRRLIATGDELTLISRGRDRYDRRLMVMQIDGVDVATSMIDAGHARPYRGGLREGWC